jgi:hypothetical protein
MEQVLDSPTPLISRTSRSLVWTGRVLTGLSVAFLLVDGFGKLVPLAPVIEATQQLGYAADVIRPLGIVLIIATLLHVAQRTQVLGALLLTAYLGGATATLVRVGSPCWFPVVIGAVLWAGLCLRNPRVRALVLAPAAA